MIQSFLEWFLGPDLWPIGAIFFIVIIIIFLFFLCAYVTVKILGFRR